MRTTIHKISSRFAGGNFSSSKIEPEGQQQQKTAGPISVKPHEYDSAGPSTRSNAHTRSSSSTDGPCLLLAASTCHICQDTSTDVQIDSCNVLALSLAPSFLLFGWCTSFIVTRRDFLIRRKTATTSVSTLTLNIINVLYIDIRYKTCILLRDRRAEPNSRFGHNLLGLSAGCLQQEQVLGNFGRQI